VAPGNVEQGAVEGRPLTAGGDGLLFDAVDQVEGVVYRFRLVTKPSRLKLRLQGGRLGTERLKALSLVGCLSMHSSKASNARLKPIITRC
jgi:hypothetical protein